MRRISFHFTTTQIIVFSFLAAVLLGSVLLALPISTADGKGVPYIDALFTATTSVCVTGLVTLPTVSTWSVFGQAVMLALIQIGGLGIITILTGVMLSLRKRISFGERILIQDAFNLNTVSGIVRFLKKLLIGTFIVEGTGALLYMTVFVPEFGARGIWISVFNAVSAFCNAGIDIISENSLCDYTHNPLINAVTMALIVTGGIGFIVWWDVIRVFKNFGRQRFKCLRNLTLNSKIALSVSAALILGGAAAFFIFEFNNPLTMKDFNLFEKIQASLFQSVTTRTAGFATVSQKGLTNASAVTSLLLMFIGGSPTGTAGGTKTVTAAVLIIAAHATIKNKDDASLFNRVIPKQAVSKAAAVVLVSFAIMFTSTLLLSAVTNAEAIDIAYETVSATATVGLTRDLTPSLGIAGKLIVIVTMYLGRIGPISMLVAFNKRKEKKNKIKNPTEEISIG